MPSPSSVSKAMSHALRHEPWLYELELDVEGWVGVDDLVAALRRQGADWSEVTVEDLVEVVQKADKQRHEIVGNRVRALYGHSLPGKLSRELAVPPDLLFHGTAQAVAATISRDGLLPMNRQYVHLSVDRATARAVGERKDPCPTLLVVSARKAHDAGCRFYRGNEKVWLADEVPGRFLAPE